MIDVKRLAVDAGYWDACGAPEGANWAAVKNGLFQSWQRYEIGDEKEFGLELIPRPQPQPEIYPNCDTCGLSMDYMPWHYATEVDRHLHACNECWPKVNPAQPQPELFENIKIGDYVKTKYDACEFRITELPPCSEVLPDHYRGIDEEDGEYGLICPKEIVRVSRPISSPQPEWVDGLPEWDGEGDRPPVNTAFRFSLNGESWEERVMLFDDGITCLMAHRKYPANRWHYKSRDPDMRFRPIPTPEQRQREELELLLGRKGIHNPEPLVDAILSRYTLEPKP